MVVELVDTRDLKSLGLILRAGSSPARGTLTQQSLMAVFLFCEEFREVSLSESSIKNVSRV